MDGIKHDCGHCMWHLPKHDDTVRVKWKRKYKENRADAYWICKCKDAESYGCGTFSEDGIVCKHFDDKYATNKTILEWIEKVYDKEI